MPDDPTRVERARAQAEIIRALFDAGLVPEPEALLEVEIEDAWKPRDEARVVAGVLVVNNPLALAAAARRFEFDSQHGQQAVALRLHDDGIVVTAELTGRFNVVLDIVNLEAETEVSVVLTPDELERGKTIGLSFPPFQTRWGIRAATTTKA